tara:strand:- start:44 stop:340 length:297 start_codon:yes stop_codon:yes gene_type:complete
VKIQLDTIQKTITIEEDVNLHDFYEQINGLLPGGLWREFTLKVTKVTEWLNPVTITPNTIPTQPYVSPNTYPRTGDIWYTTNSGDVELNKGVFNYNFE